MKKRLFAVTGVAATVLAIGGFGGMASADTLPGGAVAAAVTGTVTLGTCTQPSGTYNATFNQVAITGAFVDANVHPWAGVVNLPGIIASGNSIVATPAPAPCVPIVATGALLPTTFSGSGVGGNLNGAVRDGGFVQAGSVAVATINLSYCVSATTCTVPTSVTSGAVAVITVVPLPQASGGQCPSVGTTVCEAAVGPVVGGPVALPDL